MFNFQLLIVVYNDNAEINHQILIFTSSYKMGLIDFNFIFAVKVNYNLEVVTK